MTLEGKLHLAPIDNPHNVLDIGTGTGIWAMLIPFFFLEINIELTLLPLKRNGRRLPLRPRNRY